MLITARRTGFPVPTRIDEFLDDMSISEEAIKLGADLEANSILEELADADDTVLRFLKQQPASSIYFLRFWQEKSGTSLSELATHWMNNESTWSGRMVNHGYASLFWLSKGKKGRRIRKFYSGYKTLLNLSGGNIRYFLEIIDAAIKYELKENKGVLPNLLVISPKSQTLALKDVGKRRLDQLEGLADHGVQLKRLVLTVGKVFFELARSPANKSPETNSFIISGTSEEIEEITKLLKDGVGHLAFESEPRTKDTSSVELRDDEYRLHRIFSGFFEISHRKKRRTTFAANDLLEAVKGKPSIAIAELLGDETSSNERDLPEQLAFFSAFYDGSGG